MTPSACTSSTRRPSSRSSRSGARTRRRPHTPRRGASRLPAVFVLVALLPLLPGARPAGAAEPILIGEIDSRTGILAAQGLATAEGVRIAIDAVNAAGGVGGRPLRLLERDDEGKAERAIAAAEELVARHGVVGLVGGYVDSLVGPVSEVAERARVPYLAAASLDGLRPNRIAALGVAILPEGRRLFDELSVGENLAMGAYLPEARRRAAAARALVGGLFPALADRRDAAVHELSAREQQMVALGRTLMASPRCLVLDAGRILVTGSGPELLDNPEVQRTLLDLGREAPA